MYCQKLNFFYFKLDRDHGSDYIFSINQSLIVMAIEILFSKFLSFESMEYGNEISSNEDEFDFSLLNDEITFIKKLMIEKVIMKMKMK